MDAPSFSLGLDFDLDTEPDQTPTPTQQQQQQNPYSKTFRLIDDDDDFNEFNIPSPVMHCNNISSDDYNNNNKFDVPSSSKVPPPPLKQLRRFSEPIGTLTCNNNNNGDYDYDDDIEDFSSQDEENKPPTRHPYSGCSSSKISLHGHKVLTTQSASKCKMTQKEQATHIPVSTGATNSNTFTFPNLIVSPLRKFQLIDSDSDSDDPCANEYDSPEASKVNLSSKRKLHDSGKNPTMSGGKRANASKNMPQERDLWDDFNTETKFSIPTPALDEVCEEYFKSVKNKRTDPPSTNLGSCSKEIKNCGQTRLIIDNDGVHCKLDDPIPPAHHYYYNEDLRIQNLVRSRLPFFFPLGATKGDTLHSAPSVIDYKSQFNHGESSKPQSAKKTNAGTGSKNVKKNSRKSRGEEIPHESESWVNPRSSVVPPTDAGKRRVHAVGGQSSGHWFTSPEGKKVYISKTGEELTGRSAYIHYRKENGKAFKKAGGKKKSVGKKNVIGKKR